MLPSKHSFIEHKVELLSSVVAGPPSFFAGACTLPAVLARLLVSWLVLPVSLLGLVLLAGLVCWPACLAWSSALACWGLLICQSYAACIAWSSPLVCCATHAITYINLRCFSTKHTKSVGQCPSTHQFTNHFVKLTNKLRNNITTQQISTVQYALFLSKLCCVHCLVLPPVCLLCCCLAEKQYFKKMMMSILQCLSVLSCLLTRCHSTV